MGKLFVVTTELEVYVFAETADEAKDIAFDGGRMGSPLHDDLNNISERDLVAGPARHCNWEDDNLVYHDGSYGDLTVREACASTPEYQEALQHIARLSSGAKDSTQKDGIQAKDD